MHFATGSSDEAAEVSLVLVDAINTGSRWVDVEGSTSVVLGLYSNPNVIYGETYDDEAPKFVGATFQYTGDWRTPLLANRITRSSHTVVLTTVPDLVAGWQVIEVDDQVLVLAIEMSGSASETTWDQAISIADQLLSDIP